MKYQILNNEKIQFFNTIGHLMGEIFVSGSGDLVILPKSGSDNDIILGDQSTAGDVEIGLPSAESTLKLMGGGKISANGNTLTIGDSSLGDTVIFDASQFSGSFSGSFQGDGSALTGVSGGGGTTVVANPGGSPGSALTTITIAGADFSVGGGSVTAGTVSSSAQITAFGFVTSSATASFVTNSQTSSMTVLSSSFATTASYAATASLLLGTVVSASYAITASFLLGGGSTPTGTVSGSAQITALGFISSSATASFVTNSQTSSFVVNSQTSSFVVNSQTSSFLTNSSTASFDNLTITNLSGSVVPGDGSTTSYAVTVVSSGGDKFAIDLGSGAQTTPDFTLLAGNTYRFTQNDSSNGSHPFGFAISSSQANYTTGVTTNGTPGDSGTSPYTQIVVTNSTPKLLYRCTSHGLGMGNYADISINTGSVIQNGFLTVSGSVNVSGSLNVISGNISGSHIGDGSALTNLPGGGIFHETGSYYATTNDLQISGSATISGSLNVFGGIRQTSGVGANVVLIGNSATLGTTANAEGAVSIGDGAFADMKAVAIGEVARAGLDSITIGAGAGSGTSTGRGSIAIGINAQPTATAISSITLAANDQNEGTLTVSERRTFGVYLENSNNDAPDLKYIIGPTSQSYWNGGGNFGFGTTTPDAPLTVSGSGSTVFNVIGSQGTLFAVDDDLEGTLFTANDKTGLPVIEASSSGELYFGKSPQSLYTTAVISSNTANITQSIYGIETGSFEGGFFEYTAFSGSDLNKSARAGNIMAIWSGSTVNFTETTTTDFGDTSNLLMQVQISQSQAQLQSYSTTPGYKIKAIIRSI
jgi:hypothetical protein